jgi:hypothetical protein
LGTVRAPRRAWSVTNDSALYIVSELVLYASASAKGKPRPVKQTLGLDRAVAFGHCSCTMLHSTSVLLAARGLKLFEVARKLPNYGYGQRFTRKTWIRNGHGDDSFWMLTRIIARKEGTRLKAYGRFTWRGVTEEKEREIRGAHKREWKLFAPNAASSPPTGLEGPNDRTRHNRTETPGSSR